MAGLISLVNRFRFNERTPYNLNRLGFLNPLLYTGQFRRKVVNDILIGSNQGCGTDGFEADYGWDPVRPAALVSFPSHFQCGLIFGSIRFRV